MEITQWTYFSWLDISHLCEIQILIFKIKIRFYERKSLGSLFGSDFLFYQF